MKPLFIPLKRAFYEAFRKGTKVAELRKYGPRWNELTCWVGRDVVLSCGYGKTARLHGSIASVAIVDSTDLPQEDQLAVAVCYGQASRVIVITIGNIFSIVPPHHTGIIQKLARTRLSMRELQLVMDAAVEEWHAGDSPLELPEFLGLTHDEYDQWVANPTSIGSIVDTHRGIVPTN